MIDEFAAVAGIDTQQGEGQGLTDVVDGAIHPLLALAQDSPAGHPAGGDVHGAEGVEVLPSALSPQWATRSISRKPGWCSFHSAKVRGDGSLKQGAWFGGGERPPMIPVTVGTEQPVDGGGAHGAYLFLNFRFQDQFPVTFQDLQQLGQEGLQPLGTYPVAGFPQGLRERIKALRCWPVRLTASSRIRPFSRRPTLMYRGLITSKYSLIPPRVMSPPVT